MSKELYFDSQNDGVHSPESFGFDMSNPVDRTKWQEITGEIPITVKVEPVFEEKPMGVHNFTGSEQRYWEDRGF